MEFGENCAEAETVVYIEGMTCMSCVRNIEQTVGSRVGIKMAKVALGQKFGYFRYNPTLISAEDIAEAVDDMGFVALQDKSCSLSAVWINVIGMTCNSCVQNIEASVRQKRGVKLIEVSLEQKVAAVVYDTSLVNASSS